VHGDIGTGKTTIARRLYNGLRDEEQYQVAMIIATDLKTNTAFLRAILAELGISPKRSHSQDVQAFQSYAATAYKHGKNLVLLIDEAQKLNFGMLDVIWDILNFEADNEKFIQIILLGQNELAEKFDSDRAQALKDRVSMFGSLGPLTLEDMVGVIVHRWEMAGGIPPHPFTPSALQALHKLSGGSPRKINKLCSVALFQAESLQTKTIDDGLIEYAAVQLRMVKEDK